MSGVSEFVARRQASHSSVVGRNKGSFLQASTPATRLAQNATAGGGNPDSGYHTLETVNPTSPHIFDTDAEDLDDVTTQSSLAPKIAAQERGFSNQVNKEGKGDQDSMNFRNRDHTLSNATAISASEEYVDGIGGSDDGEGTGSEVLGDSIQEELQSAKYSEWCRAEFPLESANASDLSRLRHIFKYTSESHFPASQKNSLRQRPHDLLNRITKDSPALSLNQIENSQQPFDRPPRAFYPPTGSEQNESPEIRGVKATHPHQTPHEPQKFPKDSTSEYHDSIQPEIDPASVNATWSPSIKNQALANRASNASDQEPKSPLKPNDGNFQEADGRDEMIPGSNFGKRRSSLDHDKAELMRMDFQQLQSEPFDIHTAENTSAHRPSSSDYSTPVSELERVAQVDNEKARSEQLRAILNSLDLEGEYACAKFFSTKLSKIIAELQEIRNEKRNIALRFEKEIALQEQNISRCSNTLDQKLADLRRSGEKVVRPRVARND